jgi:hypothetical protein
MQATIKSPHAVFQSTSVMDLSIQTDIETYRV